MTARSKARGIAETYIHIKNVPDGITAGELKGYLQNVAPKIAYKQFGEEISVEVFVIEGSIITKIRVTGEWIVKIAIVYGGLRAGIDYAVNDSREFSDLLINKVIVEKSIPEDSLYRVEKRLGVPGKIQRFYKKLDKLEEEAGNKNISRNDIEDLREEFTEIVRHLESDSEVKIFEESVPKAILDRGREIPRLPKRKNLPDLGPPNKEND